MSQEKVEKKSQIMDIERPSGDFVKSIYRQSKVFTAVAVAFCVLVYFGISRYYAGDAIQTQARFNTIFQSLLVAAWTWFMFPYIRVTLQMLLYGMKLNEQTAAFFSKPEESPLVQYIEARLDREKQSLDSWKRIGEKIESELPSFLKRVDEGFNELKETSKKLSIVMERNDSLAQDAKPVIESLKRIEASIEAELNNGFMDEVRTAAAAVRSMGGLPVKAPSQGSTSGVEKEDLSFALNSIRKSKASGRT